MKRVTKKIRVKQVLLVSVVSVFLGRAWQFLFWDAPYRAFFWDEELLGSLVSSMFETSWYDYVTSSSTDDFINGLVFFTGILYLMSGISCVFYNKKESRISKVIIYFGGFNLVLLSFLLMKDKYYQFGQFFEHSIQFALPFVFVNYMNGKLKNTVLILKVLIAVVFVSHGLYAIGYYPVPGKFLDMVIQVFQFSENTSKGFLKLAGVLDFIVAIAIFLPKTSRLALVYAMVWGLLTAFARIIANFQVDFLLETIHQEFYGTLYRVAHGLVPLAVLLLERKAKN